MANSFETTWAVAHQAPLSMGFSRQDYWSGPPGPPRRLPRQQAPPSRPRPWRLHSPTGSALQVPALQARFPQTRPDLPRAALALADLGLPLNLLFCVCVYLCVCLSRRLYSRNSNLSFLRPYYQPEEGEENPFICSLGPKE